MLLLRKIITHKTHGKSNVKMICFTSKYTELCREKANLPLGKISVH